LTGQRSQAWQRRRRSSRHGSRTSGIGTSAAGNPAAKSDAAQRRQQRQLDRRWDDGVGAAQQRRRHLPGAGRVPNGDGKLDVAVTNNKNSGVELDTV
jgi:hypothetical protein